MFYFPSFTVRRMPEFTRPESNTFRSGYSNSGNGSIADEPHEHKREIARHRRQAFLYGDLK